MAIILATVAELNGADKKVLSCMLASLVAFRVAHVEMGMLATKDAAGLGRFIGHLGTQSVLIGLVGYTAYLVKGYWGF